MNQANELYLDWGKEILEDGFLVSTRGTVSKEGIAGLSKLDLTEPLVVTLAGRKLSPSYVIEEFKWYMSGSTKAADISHAATFWDSLKDDDGDVVSNYGYWLFYDEAFWSEDKDEWISRFDNCVDILVKDPSSRKAIINIHGVDNSTMNPKDTPCTLSLQFLIRQDKLHMIVNMRSNDLVLGWCNDILQFQFIAWMMAAVLKHRFHGFKNLGLGEYIHFAGSLHVYDRHFGKLEFTDEKEAQFHSPTALNFQKNLTGALKSIMEADFPVEDTENLEWLNTYIVPLIVDAEKSTKVRPKVTDFVQSESLVQHGAFPFDEGI